MKTNDLVIAEMGPRAGVFICPAKDCPLLGSGMVWEVECRIYYRDVSWQDAEGYRVWCIPIPASMSRKQVIEAVRHRAETSKVVRVEIFNIVRPMAVGDRR